MSKMLIEQDPTHRIKATFDLPDNYSTLQDLARPEHAWFVRYVLPFLDRRPKWSGCWMFGEMINKKGRNHSGEPLVYDRVKIKGTGKKLGTKVNIVIKRRLTLEYLDPRDVPMREYKGKKTSPSYDVLHLCGNIDCCNPNHYIVCMGVYQHRDVEKWRYKYLAPGSWYDPSIKVD